MCCRFIWRKKIERDVVQGVPIDAFSVKAKKRDRKKRWYEFFFGKKKKVIYYFVGYIEYTFPIVTCFLPTRLIELL